MKVCLVNPTKTIQKLLNDLSEKYKVETIHTDNDNAIATIKTNSPQIVIVNWHDSNSAKLCSTIRKSRNKKSYTHIIAMGTADEIEGINSALKSGADDFLIVPFTTEVLTLMINIAIKNIKLHNDLQSAKKKLVKFSKEDTVTSVLNRRALLDEIIKEMGRASRKSEFTSALMVNIQNLKEIELNHGNHIADRFLGEFSRRLNKSIRPYDVIGRYELNKFLLYLPHTDTEGSKIVSQRIMKNLSKEDFIIGDHNIVPCVAIGISELDPDDINIGKTKDHHDDSMNDLILESFIRRSDFASDKSCTDGKTNIQVYTF